VLVNKKWKLNLRKSKRIKLNRILYLTGILIFSQTELMYPLNLTKIYRKSKLLVEFKSQNPWLNNLLGVYKIKWTTNEKLMRCKLVKANNIFRVHLSLLNPTMVHIINLLLSYKLRCQNVMIPKTILTKMKVMTLRYPTIPAKNQQTCLTVKRLSRSRDNTPKINHLKLYLKRQS
jgi:hypothetical protein